MLNKRKIEKLGQDLNKVLEEFNQSSNIKMTLGNCTFGRSELTFKLKGGLVTSNFRGEQKKVKHI